MKELSNFEILRLPENASIRQVISQYEKVQQTVADKRNFWLEVLVVYKSFLEGKQVTPQEFEHVGMGYNPSLAKVIEVYQRAKDQYLEYRAWLTEVELAINELTGTCNYTNNALIKAAPFIEADSIHERTLYLAILHLDENASEADIKNAYEQSKNQFLEKKTHWNNFLEKFNKDMLFRTLPIDLISHVDDEISEIGIPPAYEDPPEYTEEESVPRYKDIIIENFKPILVQLIPVRKREKTPHELRAEYMESDTYKSKKDEYIKHQMYDWKYKEAREEYKKSRVEFKQIEAAYNQLTHNEQKVYDECAKQDLQQDLTFASSEIPEDFLQSLPVRHADFILNSAHPQSDINMLYSFAPREREILEMFANSDEEVQKLVRTFERLDNHLSPPQTFLKGLTKESFQEKLNAAPLPSNDTLPRNG